MATIYVENILKKKKIAPLPAEITNKKNANARDANDNTNKNAAAVVPT